MAERPLFRQVPGKRLFAGALMLGTVATAALNFACGECASTCLTFASVSGPLTLPDTLDHTYDVELCIESVCKSFTLVTGTGGPSIAPDDPTGPAYHAGFVEVVDATHLDLDLEITHLTVEAGQVATVTVTDRSSNAVLLSETVTLPAPEERSVCDDTCEQVVVGW